MAARKGDKHRGIGTDIYRASQFDVVLIDTGNAVQKGTECVFIREKMDDIRLVGSGYL